MLKNKKKIPWKDFEKEFVFPLLKFYSLKISSGGLQFHLLQDFLYLEDALKVFSFVSPLSEINELNQSMGVASIKS